MGGCSSGAVLGLIMTISYYFALLFLTIFIIGKSFVHDDEQGWYLFWDLSLLLFGAMQLWILGRAMSPVNANCGCVMDGSGDGDNLPQLQVQNVQPQQPMVVVLPQHSQPQQAAMVPVVTTIAMPNISVPDEEDEGDAEL